MADQNKEREEILKRLSLVNASIENIQRQVDSGLYVDPNTLKQYFTQKEDLEGALAELDSIGVPDRLLIKRRDYTMSEEALAQRKAAANSPAKAEGMKGNRNAWKHGMYAQGFIRNFVKPCKSTCPHYPCDLIEDGRTKPGGECLDKEQVIATFEAIMRALDSDEDKKTRFKDLQEIMALKVGGAMQVVGNLIEDVIRDGTLCKKEKFSKDGAYLGFEVVHHPSLDLLPKLLDALGLSLNELNVTPKVQAKVEDDDQNVRSLASMLGSIGRKLQQSEEGKG